jgi:hypothetical protein
MSISLSGGGVETSPQNVRAANLKAHKSVAPLAKQDITKHKNTRGWLCWCWWTLPS